MNTMAKIAIGTIGVALFGAAIVFLTVDASEGMATGRLGGDVRSLWVENAGAPGPENWELVAQDTSQSAPDLSVPMEASSLQETYQDWVVACAQQDGGEGKATGRRCAMLQQQVSQNGRQRVISLEIKTAGASFDGVLVLPFGVDLENGVVLQVDDGQRLGPYRFRTCLPVGCVVRVTFDTAFMAALRKGKTLKVNATADGGGDIPLSISLSGFAAASARLAAIELGAVEK